MHPDTRPSSIPGVETFHRREAWQEAHLPVTGPRIAWSTIDIVAVHYPWAEPTAGGLDDIVKVREFLRRTQRDYVLRRGYSIGYSFAVDWLGGVWELRGFDIRCAANRTVNPRTIAVQVLVDWDGPATGLALASVRAIHLEVERRAERECPSLGHNMLPDPDSPTGVVRTSCAGVGISAQIAAGLTTPDRTAPPEEDLDMLVIDWRPDTPDWTACTFTGTHLAWVANGHVDAVIRRAGARRQTVSDAEFDGLIASATTTTAVPSTLTGARRAAWEAQRR